MVQYERMIGTCATRLNNQKKIDIETKLPISFHAGDFLERILLFDEYILDSFCLSEIPHLVNLFGYEHTLELLESKTIKIFSDTFSGFGSTGRISNVSEYRAKKGDLPLFSYCIDPLRIVPYQPGDEDFSEEYEKYQKKFIHNNLQQINTIPNLGGKDKIKLRRAIAQSIVQLSEESISSEIYKKNYSDYKNHDPTIKLAIATKINNTYIGNIDPDSIDITIEFIDDHDFKVITNLKELTGFKDEVIDKIIERSILAISYRNVQVARMRDLNCIIGSKEESESMIYSGALDSLLNRSTTTSHLELKFKKVTVAKGLPDFDGASKKGDINLSKILSIRNKRECVEFREWLWSQENIDEKELKDALESFTQLFSDFHNTNIGKTISILTSAGIGEAIVPTLGSLASSLGMGTLDKFIIEKIIPRKGPLIFINNNLTSIYNDPYFLYKMKNEK